MDIRIQSIHFDASEQLQAFIQKKVSKLEKYYEDIKKVEVSLKVVKPEVAENKEAGIKILIPNGEFYASKVCDTFEEAIDLDVEALVKQLVKYKEKQRSNSKQRHYYYVKPPFHDTKIELKFYYSDISFRR